METFIPGYQTTSKQIEKSATINRGDFLEEIKLSKNKKNWELLICLENPHVTNIVFTDLRELQEEYTLSNEETAAFGSWLYNDIYTSIIQSYTDAKKETIDKEEVLKKLEDIAKNLIGFSDIQILTREQIIAKESEMINEEDEDSENRISVSNNTFDEEPKDIGDIGSLLDAHDEEGVAVCQLIYDPEKYDHTRESVVISICDTIYQIFSEIFYSKDNDNSMQSIVEEIFTDELTNQSVQQQWIKRQLHKKFMEKNNKKGGQIDTNRNIFHTIKEEVMKEVLYSNICIIEDLVEQEKLRSDSHTTTPNIKHYIQKTNDNTEKARIQYEIDEYIDEEILPKVNITIRDIQEKTEDKCSHFINLAEEKIYGTQ